MAEYPGYVLWKVEVEMCEKGTVGHISSGAEVGHLVLSSWDVVVCCCVSMMSLMERLEMEEISGWT